MLSDFPFEIIIADGTKVFTSDNYFLQSDKQ